MIFIIFRIRFFSAGFCLINGIISLLVNILPTLFLETVVELAQDLKEVSLTKTIDKVTDEGFKYTCLLSYISNFYLRKILLGILHGHNFYDLPTDAELFYKSLEKQSILKDHLSKLEHSKFYENIGIVYQLKNQSCTTTWSTNVLLVVILNVSLTSRLSESLRKALERLSIFKTYCFNKDDFEKGFKIIEDFLYVLKDENGFKDSKIHEILREIQTTVKNADIIIEDVTDHQLLSPFVLPKLTNMFENLLQGVNNNSVKKKALFDALQAISIYGNYLFYYVFCKKMIFEKILLIFYFCKTFRHKKGRC